MPSRTRTRTRTRSGIRPAARRHSPCYRHPDEPLTGICASCLRERLSGLDSSITTTEIAAEASPELRRSRSVVSGPRCEASADEQRRRKSCDIVSDRSSLSNLFDVDDLKIGSETEVRVESNNVGLSRVTYTVIQSVEEIGDEIRVSDKLRESNADCADEEFKTMKEYIDLEFQNKARKSKDLREIAGNFFGAASVFTKKLQKWRQKNNTRQVKKLSYISNEENGIITGSMNLQLTKDVGNNVGRRSCDTEPRFSVDEGRISFEEPRASWDGYMIARTIPRLAPMFSVVEDGILGNMNNNRFEHRRSSVDGPMHSIVEDESSSGAHSNSDSSSSQRQSSFDRSSSVRSFSKKADHGVSPANVKLVITEKELKDWRLSSGRDDDVQKLGAMSRNNGAGDGAIGSLNAPPVKKAVKWHNSIRNLFGFKEKMTKHVNVDPMVDGTQGMEACGWSTGDAGWKLARTRSSGIGLRNSSDAVIGSYHGRRSVDHVDGYDAFKGRQNLDSGSGNTPPFYMTPLRSLKNSKSGKFSRSVAGHVLQLN